jgi:hypothetical protein
MASDMENPRRLVTLQRDGAEFVVSFYPESSLRFDTLSQNIYPDHR